MNDVSFELKRIAHVSITTPHDFSTVGAEPRHLTLGCIGLGEILIAKSTNFDWRRFAVTLRVA